jgi:hypothetical protein
MNDDVSGTYLQMGAADPLAEDNARFMAAQQEDQANTFYERVKTSVAGAVGIEDRTKGAGTSCSTHRRTSAWVRIAVW